MALPATVMGMNRRTMRSTPNPFDLATIFNIFPRDITERKRTISPGIFTIPAGTPDNPGRLVVGSSSWWRDMDPDQPLLEIPISAVVVADSVVKDYNNARIGSDMSGAQPGLFYLPGEITVEKLKKEYMGTLQAATERQKAWFAQLVKLGDALWARSNGNPIAIDDDMRLAAKELGMEREWLSNFRSLDLVKCIACGNMRNPAFPVCPHCKAIVDPEKAKGLTFAK